MCAGVRIPQVSFYHGVLAQSEACVLSKHEVLGSKPRYSTVIRYGVVGNISACHADARGSIPRFGVLFCLFIFFFSIIIYFWKKKKNPEREI